MPKWTWSCNGTGSGSLFRPGRGGFGPANAEEIPRWTLNLEYDGDIDLEPQAAYDACKAGTCWDSVELRGSLRLDEQYIFRCRAMSHFICSDFCVLST